MQTEPGRALLCRSVTSTQQGDDESLTRTTVAFLYWADKLGYLVWGEYPNWGCNFKPESYSAYVNEWTGILLRDRKPKFDVKKLHDITSRQAAYERTP